MSKLVRLRKLCLDSCCDLRHMPLGLEKMTDLCTLDRFVARRRSWCSAANPNNPNEFDDDKVGRLADLNRLNNLEGTLAIVADGNLSSSESVAANLHGKKKLTELRIFLGGGSNRANEMTLEGFQPHTNLRNLVIGGYEGERLPSWIDQRGYNLTNLKEIHILGWKASRCVGTFGRLPHLEVLKILDCRDLEYIESGSSDNAMNADADIDPSAPSAAPLFPSLEILTLCSLPKLKGWRMMCTSRSSSHDENFLLGASARAFPRLKELQLKDVRAVPEEFRGLSSLESLEFENGEHLKELPELIDSLTSLKKLRIANCPNLISLSKRMLQLSNLESLQISGCLSLEGSPTIEDWPPIPRLPKLKRLALKRLGLEFIPEEFQGLSSLESLEVYDWQQLQEIPEWIDTFTSLKDLTIENCPKPISLPKQIANLANLKFLLIAGNNPHLKERCKKPTGEDWHLIQHVPCVNVWN